ncbi:MAG: V-type ATP synthase subunit C [Methanobrevibacter sp.]|uniref:V-type ATP synthase subunit C n=1 Tax=Methanobrevibacter sp. TaxID=66852 RepID=UPI0026DF9C90|nr:V-type ATP synthase subunit C [Methanobrevibacter sp.]MDO5848910.1 V-type ATP synthase subunit C [Methanobrevibacter sp.]
MADEIAALISSIGLTQETFLVLCIIAIVVVGAIVVIIATRPVLDIYPYLNPSARVRARKGRLFTEKQMTELVEANDVAEVENYLKGVPDYAETLDDYPLDKALDIQAAKTYDFIARLAPKEVKDPFVVMSKKTDVDNIKSLITAKEVGLTPEETKDLLIPGGHLYDDLSNLADADNVTDIVTALDGSEYATVLEDALPAYEDSGMILPLESALDKYYLKKLLKSTDVPSDENREIVYSFVGTKVDIANLKLIIRAKEDGLTYDMISPYMLEEGYQLREWKLKDLMESPDVTNVISGLEGTKYAEALSDAIAKYNETGNVAVFERALDEYLASHAKSLASKKPLGVGPIIGYVSQKETEIKNLKIIARAKREVGFPNSKIMEMLI